MMMYHNAGTRTVRAAVAACLFSGMIAGPALLAYEPPLKPAPIEEAFLLPVPVPGALPTTTNAQPATGSAPVTPAGVAKVTNSSPATSEDIQRQISENVNRMQTFDQKHLGDTVSDEELQRVFKDFKIQKAASSDATTRQQAVRELPFRQMSQKDQMRCQQVLSKVSLYRHMPTISFEVDPQAYQYFVSHPDVAVAIWRGLGVTKMNLYQTGPQEYECDDKAGTQAVVDYLFRGNGVQVVYVDGDFASPFLNKPIHGSAIFALKSELKPQADGRFFVTHTADVFISFPSTAIETAAKLISPISNVIADRNFREVSLFVHTMSKAMQNQPSWIEQMANKMDGVLPDRKAELISLTATVYNDERRRQQSLTGVVPAMKQGQ
jgi:hypothetical protein